MECAMNRKESTTTKETVIHRPGHGKRFWMSTQEYTDVIAGKGSTNSEYVITDGIIEPGGFVPDHYHKWEDQTFHVISGTVSTKIGSDTYDLQAGDSVHCPRGVSHFIENTGDKTARLISYIFPGDWAEDFMEETTRQMQSGVKDLKRIEDEFGVVYLKSSDSETA
jgi:quercetin dioxygenase-like cupin family protein